MTTIFVDPAELADAAAVLRQAAASLAAVAQQVNASCCCCVASPALSGEVDGAGSALQGVLQSVGGGLSTDAGDLATRGAAIAADQSLGAAVTTSWTAPVSDTSGLYPSGMTLGGGGGPDWTITLGGAPVSDTNGLYPSGMTLGGGGGPDWTITLGGAPVSDTSGLYPSGMTLGGGGGPDWTITDPSGAPADMASLYPSEVSFVTDYSRGPMSGFIGLAEVQGRMLQDLRGQALAYPGSPDVTRRLGAAETYFSNLLKSEGQPRSDLEGEYGYGNRTNQSHGPDGDVPFLT